MSFLVNTVEYFKLNIKNLNLNIYVLVLFLVNIVIFNNTLYNDFAWDDYVVVNDNTLVKDFSINSIKTIFSLDRDPVIYIPMTFLSFSIDYQIGQYNPFYYHLTNLLLHISNSIMVFFLILKLTGSKKIGIITSLIFSVNPIHVESIAWITERKDVLSVFFFLISYLFFIKNNKVCYLISIITFTMSIFSKPLTITLPFLLIMNDYILIKDFSLKKYFHKYILFFIVTLASLYINLFLKHSEGFPKPGLLDSIHMISIIYGKYFTMAVFPVNLSCLYYDVVNLNVISLWEKIIYPLIFIGLIYVCIFVRGRFKTVSFGIIWFIVTMIPNLVLYNFPVAMADRYLYLPSIGIYLVIAVIFNGIYKLNNYFKYVSIILAGSLILTYSFITIKQNYIWKNNITLMENAYNKCKDRNGYIPNTLIQNLSQDYIKANQPDKAITLINSLLSSTDKQLIDKKYSVFYVFLGDCFLMKREYKFAVNAYKEAIKLNPENINGYLNLGHLYYETKEYNLSYETYNKALKVEPNRNDVKDFLLYLEALNRDN